jgi:hypothetical protein
MSSDMLGPTQNISHHLELQQYEEQLKVLFESKLDDFCKEVWVLWLEAGANGETGSMLTKRAAWPVRLERP